MKDKEQITEEALSAIADRIKGNVKIFRGMENRRELNINKIESFWGTAKTEVSKVMDELYNELVNAIPEKEIIEDKKKL
ncbi:MAG: hypothetical protein Ta2E_13130 [Mycoplasmoidaceae bacterium]|nr:MAG: hypothetical protein Ta2E_13130 [Mycoplasmoidaceae bacterium]